ncbi:MAG: phospholipase D family protein [Gammaproteobacteria bacterium]
MIELLRSPWTEQFDALLSQASKSLLLCAPFIGRGPCQRVKTRLINAALPDFEVTVLTDLSRDNILSGMTDVAALADLVRTWPTTAVRFLPSLHAKVYVADTRQAIITSGNLTNGGLFRNFEYGVLFDDHKIVQTIERDVRQYALLGSPIDRAQLETFASVVSELRFMRQAAERSVKSRMRREFNRRLREVDYQLLTVRAAGRTAHAIFADAIAHLLRKRPMTTAEINQAIQRIHPDLCDDLVDRVIDGQHFGKKWKHGVRTAQVFLRRRGEIRLEGKLWRLT